MLRKSLLLLLLASALAAQVARTVAPTSNRRLALVIGNQAYARLPLRNPRADARSMDALLRGELAFTEVDKVEDASLVAMQRAIREFVRKVRPGDLALFYYSGHGMQVAGNNWMIPVDFHAEFDDDVPDQAYSAQRVLKELEDAGASVRILILDACRDNPLPAAGHRSGKDGLVPMTGAEGTYLLYATAENSTASDNPRGANGLFTSYLLESMRKAGVTLDQAFKETRRAVSAATNGKQRPWLATDIDQDLVLRPGSPAAAAPVRDVAAEQENLFWSSIKDGTDRALFAEYLRRFPNGVYRVIAESRMAAPGGVVSPPATEPARVGGHRVGETTGNPKDGLTYVWIEPGTFSMGCSPGDGECDSDEKPAHQVIISKGFWMGQTPVTQEAYRRVVGTSPSLFKGLQLPVEQVDWSEAKSYCAAAGMRLPTEAEWEYAARAGSTTSRYGEIGQIAWYSENSGSKTHEVRQKAPNTWGLYDMLGNVWQWTADWYTDKYAANSETDPRGAASGQYRTLRGGSWSSVPGVVRVSDRGWGAPSGRVHYFGLRCVGN